MTVQFGRITKPPMVAKRQINEMGLNKPITHINPLDPSASSGWRRSLTKVKRKGRKSLPPRGRGTACGGRSLLPQKIFSHKLYDHSVKNGKKRFIAATKRTILPRFKALFRAPKNGKNFSWKQDDFNLKKTLLFHKKQKNIRLVLTNDTQYSII